ncbi:MAG: AGE family epimerase/isomerase [Pontixanthobacter sp.]
MIQMPITPAARKLEAQSESQLVAQALARRAQRWMLEEAFPFWAERTPDPAGGFYERLDLQGAPIAGELSRVRLQARMVFTFSLAAQLGWEPDRALAMVNRGIESLTQFCRRDDGLYGRIVQTGYGLVDDTAETYDTAFALLALSKAANQFGLEVAYDAGAALNLAIDRKLKLAGRESGFRERLPAPLIREQNPHMHLTEASLAWFEATGDQAALDRALSIIDFVHAKFFNADTGILFEFSGGAGPDNHIETGHLFEWVWILGRLRQVSPHSRQDFADALYDGGMRLLEGFDYLPLSQNCDGSVREAVQRTWGPTEKLKAHIAHWRVHPSDELAQLVIQTAQGLFADHVDHALPGAWVDAIAPDRRSMIKDITPATGYHIFLALQELIAFADELNT